MDESTAIELVYDGEEVKTGSIPIEYLIHALSGFSGAYEKVSGQTEGQDIEHRIKVVGLRHDSIHILLDIFEFIKANPAAAGVIETGVIALTAGAYKVVKDISKYIEAKRHLRGKSPRNSILFEGDKIFLVDPETGDRLQISKEEADRLLMGLLDSDVERMVLPLNGTRVTDFEIRHKSESLVKVNSKEKSYFAYTPPVVTGTESDRWMEGTLNSLTKDRARGTFHTVSGKHVPYRYVGHDQHQLIQAFAHDGVVRALSDVHFDAENNPCLLDIKAIEIGQRTFFTGT